MPSAATIRSTSVRSAPVSPRSGAQHLGRTGTPRKPSAAFDAAWNGKRCSSARSAVACSAARGVGSRTSGTTASGKLAGETRDGAGRSGRERALEQRLGADEDVEPLERGTARGFSHGLSETFIPAKFGARSRSRSITGSGIA